MVEGFGNFGSDGVINMKFKHECRHSYNPVSLTIIKTNKTKYFKRL